MPIQMAPVKYDPIILRGGLDLITPTLALKPGVPRNCLNFEILESGQPGRIAGYERYSGQPRPSDAVYGVVWISVFANVPVVGNTITNGTATAQVIEVGGDYVAYTKLAGGTFAVGNSITVGATPIGTTVTPTSSLQPADDARLLNLAADVYRADIAKPTGSGPIRGVFVYNDTRYCLRDNAGATAQNLWKSSNSGWTAVPLFFEVSFTAGGTATPADGQTLTQGGVTAVIRRVVTETGAWTGTAAGRFIIAAPGGGNFAAGAATVTTSGATLTLSGIQTAITLSPGGKGEVVQANFFGQATSARIYYADGVNRLWEFDGTTLVPITTGGLIPKHLAIHKRYLFYSVNSSIFYQQVGNPYSAVGGAEIATGDAVTGFLIMPGAQTSAALAVLNRNSTNMLYGTSAADWNLVSYNFGTGALDYTLQNMAQSCLLDDRGVFTLQASLNFGNFDQASLTHLIRPFITAHRPYVCCSGLNRLKSQYRVFYTDGYGLYLTIVNNTFIGVMPVKFPTYANCTWESTLTSGETVMLMGGGDGHVYDMEKGSSFDGEKIPFFITFNWASQGNSRMLHRYRKGSIEIAGGSYARVSFGYSLGYGSDNYLQANPANYEALMSSGQWDSGNWDSFSWDGRALLPTDVEMVGTAENVQITLSGNSDEYEAFSINSVIVHYTPRRGLR